MNGRLLLLYCLLLVGVAVSGVLVAKQAQQVRELHAELDNLRKSQDRLLADHGRLLLERGALSAYQNVESIAKNLLAMRFPEHAERLAP